MFEGMGCSKIVQTRFALKRVWVSASCGWPGRKGDNKSLRKSVPGPVWKVDGLGGAVKMMVKRVQCCGFLGFEGDFGVANAIMVIYPYKYEGMWVFDDESAGLDKEPFVEGADELIGRAVEMKGITERRRGFG